MKKRIFRYFKHIILTILCLLILAIFFGLYHGASLHYGDHALSMNLENDGPYIFYQNDSIISVDYIKGNKNDGFYTDQYIYPIDSHSINIPFHFPLDSSKTNFTISPEIEAPKGIYEDGEEIIAISDIESSYKTFRDFLIFNRVIDQNLEWIYGKGHLVLVGDFVDRGNSTTQVLWFIYKLEQEAKKHGGTVHFIIGNHELKNMQGRYKSASPKYYAVAAILGRQPSELYAKHSLIGKWLSSKNSIEKINGHLFVHGGIHPDIIDYNIEINEINQLLRKHYYLPYFPRNPKSEFDFLRSNRTGVSWYRGYYKEDLKQDEINNILGKFNAKSIVIGHTIQSKVNRKYDGKIIGIDVKHPNDYNKSWPNQKSEGLRISKNQYFRLFHNGKQKEI